MASTNIKREDLHLGDQIGSGGFSTIFKATLNGQEVAVKRLHTPDKHEVDVLKTLDHPHIVKFIGALQDDDTLYLVLELCRGGSLRSYLDRKRFEKKLLPIYQIYNWANQAVKPIQYLHTRKFVHKDIKSPNYLITDNDILKLADFGITKNIESTIKNATQRCSPAWGAPELLKDNILSPSYDISAYGVILWELCTTLVPFEGCSQHNIIWRICKDNERPVIPASCPKPLAELISKCWEVDWHKRPSADEILQLLSTADEIPEKQKFIAGPWKCEKVFGQQQERGEPGRLITPIASAINPTNHDVAVIDTHVHMVVVYNNTENATEWRNKTNGWTGQPILNSEQGEEESDGTSKSIEIAEGDDRGEKSKPVATKATKRKKKNDSKEGNKGSKKKKTSSMDNKENKKKSSSMDNKENKKKKEKKTSDLKRLQSRTGMKERFEQYPPKVIVGGSNTNPIALQTLMNTVQNLEKRVDSHEGAIAENTSMFQGLEDRVEKVETAVAKSMTSIDNKFAIMTEEYSSIRKFMHQFVSMNSTSTSSQSPPPNPATRLTQSPPRNQATTSTAQSPPSIPSSQSQTPQGILSPTLAGSPSSPAAEGSTPPLQYSANPGNRYNLISHALCYVENMDNVKKAVRKLMMEVFNIAELKTSTLSGKTTKDCIMQKLDPARVNQIVDYIMVKFSLSRRGDVTDVMGQKLREVKYVKKQATNTTAQ